VVRARYQQPDSRFAAAALSRRHAVRLGDPSGAIPYLREARQGSGAAPDRPVLRGGALLRTGSASEGKALLQQVQSGPPEVQTTQIAQQFMTGGGTTVVATTEEKPWSVHANAGFWVRHQTLGLVPSSSAAQAASIPKARRRLLPRRRRRNYRLARAPSGPPTWGTTSTTACTSRRRASICRATAGTSRSRRRLQNDFWQAGVAGIYDFYLLDYQSFYQGGRGRVRELLRGTDRRDPGVLHLRRAGLLPGRSIPSALSYINRTGVRQMFLLGADRSLRQPRLHVGRLRSAVEGRPDFAYMDNMFDIALDFGIFDMANAQVAYLFDLQDTSTPTAGPTSPNGATISRIRSSCTSPHASPT
jgi:hypothetical protein